MRRGWAILVLVWFCAGCPVAVIAEEHGLPDDRYGIRTAPLLLLSRADVRSDLNLNGKQTLEAEDKIRMLREQASALKGKTGNAAIAARRIIDAEQQRWIESGLSESQRSRLIQIDLQWEGTSALVTRRAVAETLALSEEQHAALKRLVAEFRLTHPQATRQMADEANLMHRATEVLNETQRRRWEAILGAPFVPRFAAAAPK